MLDREAARAYQQIIPLLPEVVRRRVTSPLAPDLARSVQDELGRSAGLDYMVKFLRSLPRDPQGDDFFEATYSGLEAGFAATGAAVRYSFPRAIQHQWAGHTYLHLVSLEGEELFDAMVRYAFFVRLEGLQRPQPDEPADARTIRQRMLRYCRRLSTPLHREALGVIQEMAADPVRAEDGTPASQSNYLFRLGAEVMWHVVLLTMTLPYKELSDRASAGGDIELGWVSTLGPVTVGQAPRGPVEPATVHKDQVEPGVRRLASGHGPVLLCRVLPPYGIRAGGNVSSPEITAWIDEAAGRLFAVALDNGHGDSFFHIFEPSRREWLILAGEEALDLAPVDATRLSHPVASTHVRALLQRIAAEPKVWSGAKLT